MSVDSRDRIRILRKRDIADTVKDVVNNKTDMREIETSMHALFSRHEKHVENERDVLFCVVKANLLLARVVGDLQVIALNQAEQIKRIENLCEMPRE